jgi:hypothetical protein
MVHIDPQLLKDIQSNPYNFRKLTIKEIADYLNKQIMHIMKKENHYFTDDI